MCSFSLEFETEKVKDSVTLVKSENGGWVDKMILLPSNYCTQTLCAWPALSYDQGCRDATDDITVVLLAFAMSSLSTLYQSTNTPENSSAQLVVHVRCSKVVVADGIGILRRYSSRRGRSPAMGVIHFSGVWHL